MREKEEKNQYQFTPPNHKSVPPSKDRYHNQISRIHMHITHMHVHAHTHMHKRAHAHTCTHTHIIAKTDKGN